MAGEGAGRLAGGGVSAQRRMQRGEEGWRGMERMGDGEGRGWRAAGDAGDAGDGEKRGMERGGGSRVSRTRAGADV